MAGQLRVLAQVANNGNRAAKHRKVPMSPESRSSAVDLDLPIRFLHSLTNLERRGVAVEAESRDAAAQTFERASWTTTPRIEPGPNELGNVS